MNEAIMIGALLAVAAGLSGGFCVAPAKLMKQYRYEHWAFLYSLVGMLILPWVLACAGTPELFTALAAVPASIYIKANLCSLAWGLANILCCLSLVRIGFSLTTGILTGVGLPVGMLLPLLIKGSGDFAGAPSLFSPAGLGMLGIALLLAFAVFLMARAGFGREKSAGMDAHGRGFRTGLLMSVAAGFLQVGLSFAFVYSQGPLMQALTAHGASDSAAVSAVWAVALFSGALANIVFPVFLLHRNRSVATLFCLRDFLLSFIMAVLFLSLLLCMGNGMRMLGALGASVGFGIYQGVQILSSQAVGIFSGEWRATPGATKKQMLLAVLLVLLAICAMAVLNIG